MVAVLAIVALSMLGLPVGHAMIGGSVLYLAMRGMDLGTAAEQLLNGMYSSFLLLAIPLFILAAEFMNSGAIMERLLRFCNALVGRFRGGMAHVNVVQSVIFTAMSGSALADAASSGRIMQTMMTKDGRYPPAFAAALTAASAVLGPVIPPSIPLVIFALISDTSIGYLLLGGILPGLLIGVAQMLLIAMVARRRNFPVEPAIPLRELPRLTWETLPALMMPVILLACLYSGATTPTEAAAAAAIYSLLVSAALYRTMGWRDAYQALLSSARVTASIGMLIAGAMVFNYVITVEHIPKTLAATLKAWELSPVMFLLFANVLLLLLGCVLEGTTILLIFVPVLMPTAHALGIDPVHFGIVVVVNVMIGLCSPPYGLLLLMMGRITGVPLKNIIQEMVPFHVSMVVTLFVLTYVPWFTLVVPRLLGYKG